jgi:Beta-galactosidase
LSDEPSANQFGDLAAWAARIRSVDPVHPSYINLFPNYSSEAQRQVKTYGEYVERFVREVPELPISFDFYPILPGYVHQGWYDNLELIADTARETGRPFWAFALSVAFGDHPIAKAPHLRLQVYSDLAYGAAVIQYFTYWTPRHVPPGDDFHDGPIDLGGNRTPVYDEVKQVNAELKALSPVFTGSQVESIGHTGAKFPPGTQRYQPKWPVKELKADAGAVVSHRTSPTRDYLTLVNRSVQEPLDVSIALDPAAHAARVTKQGQIEPLPGDHFQAALPPGDIAILTWTPAKR